MPYICKLVIGMVGYDNWFMDSYLRLSFLAVELKVKDQGTIYNHTLATILVEYAASVSFCYILNKQVGSEMF